MKQLFTFCMLVLLCTALQAQSFTPPAFADIDNNHRNYVNDVFGELEAGRVPTGLLVDYGVDFTDPRFYNGVVLHDSALMEQLHIYTQFYLIV